MVACLLCVCIERTLNLLATRNLVAIYELLFLTWISSIELQHRTLLLYGYLLLLLL